MICPHLVGVSRSDPRYSTRKQQPIHHVSRSDPRYSIFKQYHPFPQQTQCSESIRNLPWEIDFIIWTPLPWDNHANNLTTVFLCQHEGRMHPPTNVELVLSINPLAHGVWVAKPRGSEFSVRKTPPRFDVNRSTLSF